MKIIQLDQKSSEWLQWRNYGVGASDAPIIMGLSPYKKPYTLWQEKCGLKAPRPFSPFLQDRAGKIEDAARATLELEMGKNYPATCAEDETFPWMKVSFDGWNEEDRSIMEAKYVGFGKDQGKIPASHWIQMQWQMLLANTGDVIYMRSNDGVIFRSLIVHRDDRYISFMKEEIFKFWDMVLKQVDPGNERRKAGWKDDISLPEDVTL